MNFFRNPSTIKISLSRLSLWMLFSSMLLLSPNLLALDENEWVKGEWVKHSYKTNDFVLVGSKSEASIIFSDDEYESVRNTAKQLQADIFQITQRKPQVATQLPRTAYSLVIVGTLGKSSLIDELVEQGVIDVSKLRNQWDAYQIQTLKKPFPGIKQALVITGANPRGTIYGMLKLSEAIGISPWHWWADLPPAHQDRLYITHNLKLIAAPKIKYRGLSLSRESANLSRWSTHTFGKNQSQFYVRLFDLMQRLNANLLWVDANSEFFNTLTPEVKRIAANAEIILDANNLSAPTAPINPLDHSEQLSGQLSDQLSDQSKPTPTSSHEIPPSLWWPSVNSTTADLKSAQVADSTTIMWPDDFHGNLLRLPTPEERRFKGGAGIYYHLSHRGAPFTNQWLNSIPIANMQAQLNIAYTYDATRIWMLNAGDIKPWEFGVEFFFRMAWNPESWSYKNTASFTQAWVMREFGSEHAEEIAKLITATIKHNYAINPETLARQGFSQYHYREAEKALQSIAAIRQQAEALYQKISPNKRDAFYQLVVYPAQASALLTELYDAQAKNHSYANQGRASANNFGKKVQAIFALDKKLTEEYQTKISKGKWNYLRDKAHINFTHRLTPVADTTPIIYSYTPHPLAEMGISLEGDTSSNTSTNSLSTFFPYGQTERYIDIFNRGTQPFTAQASASEQWIKLSSDHWAITKDERFFVAIDWAKAPRGHAQGTITIAAKDTASTRTTINIAIENNTTAKELNGFIDADGFIAISAADFTLQKSSNIFRWQTLPEFGIEPAAISVLPITDFSFEDLTKAPFVEYEFYSEALGDIEIYNLIAPSHPQTAEHKLRFALALDNEKPQVINALVQATTGNLISTTAMRSIVSKHNLAKKGQHRLRVYMMDPGLILEKIIINTGNVKPSLLGPSDSIHF